MNEIKIVTTNSYGYAGSAERGVEVLAIPPPDEDYHISIDTLGNDPYGSKGYPIVVTLTINGVTEQATLEATAPGLYEAVPEAAGLIGPGNAIKSMEEFEALRFMRAEDMRPEQVDAINTIRNAIPSPAIGADIAKVMSYSSAQNMILDGERFLRGFFARKIDLSGANNAEQVINRLRLDYGGAQPSPLTSGEAYAILETKVNDSVSTNLGIPRASGYATGGGAGTILRPGDYPYTGNGFAASRDGHLTPEWAVSERSRMEPDVTIISFKNADGSPRVLSLGGAGASDRWGMKLIDPDNPAAGTVWEPVP
jgi:hypothetical protein